MKHSIYLLLIILAFISCSAKNHTENKDNPQEASIKIQRFDKNMYQYLQDPAAYQERLENAYKDFLPAFGRITINSSDSYKPEFYTRLQDYFSNKMLYKIYKDALEKFNNVEAYEKELSAANILIAQNFNGEQLPVLYMHVSGFKENVMVLENIISLSVDKYMGMNYPAYKQFFENYQLIQMQPEMVTRDYVKAWLLSGDILEENKKTLLSEMVKEGKVVYILSQLLSGRSIEYVLGFTPDQIMWCNENESEIWNTIVKKNHLYETDYLLINKYMNDAPYTATLTTEAPGRTGIWVGWKIVSAYMKKENISLNDLLNTDSQKILKGSAYNP